MKVDGRLEVLQVAEATGHLLDRLDLRVDAFADRVGDSVLEEVQDMVEVPLHEVGGIDDGLEPGVRGPEEPALPKAIGRGSPLVAPETSQDLFDRPRATGLEVDCPELLELLLVLGRQILLRVQPKVLGTREGFVSVASQLPVFLLAKPLAADHVSAVVPARYAPLLGPADRTIEID